MRNPGISLTKTVMIILLLSLLAVVAWPQLFSLQRSSRIGTMENLSNAIIDINEQVYAKASQEQTEAHSHAKIFLRENDPEAIYVHYGYPDWREDQVELLINLDKKEWRWGGILTGQGDYEMRIGLRQIYRSAFQMLTQDARHCYISISHIGKEVVTMLKSDDC